MSAIHTFSGKKIDPCAPDSAALSVEDIAHALSLICRAGGHFPQFYSVCQHSVACAREAAARGFEPSGSEPAPERRRQADDPRSSRAARSMSPATNSS